MPREDFLITIGLEVHVQLKTESKMFCGCAVDFGASPNSLTCPVCLGLPGSLPVLNAAAIEKTILAGLMLGCTTPPVSKWDRKNYYYPDMPKNYQISQYDLPLCMGGGVPLHDLAYPTDAQKSIEHPGKVVGLTRIHLEEDVAKSTHHRASTSIDFNRAGTPLMEIVSEPEILSGEEAFAYLTSLRQILVYGDLSDADMEKGQMRCDVNISVRPTSQVEFGAKVELKNLNSVSAVRRAIHFEIDRQIEEIESGIPQIQSTRRWDDDLGETQLMRTKESAHDYRYFPDPDLLPVETGPIIERMKKQLPELPQEKRDRFMKEYQISAYDASVLASDRALADYYERAAKTSANPKKLVNWVSNDLLSTLKEQAISIVNAPISAENLTGLINLIEEGKLSNNLAKDVYSQMIGTGNSASKIIESDPAKYEVMDNSAELAGLIQQVIEANPQAVADVQAGNLKSINFLKGQVMKLSRGKANPQTVGDLLESTILK